MVTSNDDSPSDQDAPDPVEEAPVEPHIHS